MTNELSLPSADEFLNLCRGEIEDGNESGEYDDDVALGYMSLLDEYEKALGDASARFEEIVLNIQNSGVLNNLDPIEISNTQYVKVAITDIDGVLRGKYMHIDKFLKSSTEGFGFCDVIFGWDSNDELYEFKNIDQSELFTGWHSGFPDQAANIVLDSGRKIPFEKNTPLFLSELESGEVCPRRTLKKVLSRMDDLGLKAKSAFE